LDIVSPPIRIGSQVDRLFISLAEAYGPQAIGILFSGYCHDGSEGCKCIKANGGFTIAQDKSAEASSMPLSDQTAGCIDLVLSPEKMASELLKLAVPGRHPY